MKLSVSITADAIDLLAPGGFTFIMERYVKDPEKANLEPEKLGTKPGLKSHIKQIADISRIISNPVSAANTLVGRL
ncbi:MAG: hypothetical protein LBV26_01760 [Bacteroidales bacterium]|jgi:hypothetical protein|nr:hypothetical protein [Bacteroidales bacterium]